MPLGVGESVGEKLLFSLMGKWTDFQNFSGGEVDFGEQRFVVGVDQADGPGGHSHRCVVILG